MIVRKSVEEKDEKIIKNQVMNKLDDHLIRTQVRGIDGGASPIVLESLNVTANGIYTPPEGVDGYNEITVEVTPAPTLPEKILKSYMDFETGIYRDISKDVTISTQSYTGVISDAGLKLNANASRLRLSEHLSDYRQFDIEIETGTSEEVTNTGNNFIFYFDNTSNNGSFGYSATDGAWKCIRPNNNDLVLTDLTNTHYFDNKKLLIRFGYDLVDGVFTKNINNPTLYEWDQNVNDYILICSFVNNILYNAEFSLGSRTGSNSFNGFRFKNVKIYEYLNKNNYSIGE